MSLILSGTDGLSDVDGSAATPAIRGTDTNTGIFFPAADTIAFSEGGVEAARFDSAGNLGVGTTSPTGRLHLVNSAATCNLIIDGQSAANKGSLLTLRKGGADMAYIGQGSVLLGGGSTSNDLIIYAEGAVYQAFYTNAQERARIGSTGEFLVGTTASWGGSPKMEVRQSGVAWGLSSYQTGTGGGALLLRVDNTASVLAGFYYTGSVNVGNISTNGTATTYGTVSDYRLKENIQPMTEALAKVAALNPVTYKWKANGSDGQGFIAHELQAVVPDCVTGEKDGVETYTDEDGNEQTRPKYQGIDTSFLVATLTAAIQEQQALITQLQADVAALKVN